MPLNATTLRGKNGPTTMIDAASYARYSTDLQNDRSIDDQHFENGKLAEANDCVVVKEYSDRAMSGASVFGRTGLHQLMQDARAGKFQAVVVEGLDRISRDQEELSAIFKRLTFLDIALYSSHDGKVDSMTVSVRGMQGAFFMSDLSQKIHRGQAGVVRDGRSAGGRAYGYRPVAGATGHLEIVEGEAEVIRRIFQDFANGLSPRRIAADLNAEGVMPPRGNYWSASALNGNKARGYGILSNPLYGGKIVWNRVRMLRNPDTGKRVSRVNPKEKWQEEPAPDLAIVDKDLFARVQTKIEERSNGEQKKPWRHRKPKRLLSGLLKCGCCGGGMSIKDHSRYGTRIQCSAAKEGGACKNTRAFPLEAIEHQVVKGLSQKLGSTAAIAAFVKAYNDERRALAADAINRRSAIEMRLKAIATERERTVDLLVRDVIREEDGALKLKGFEAETANLQAELAGLEEPPNIIELHPTAVSDYLKTIDRLAEALTGEEGADALMPVRELIDRVVVTPGDDGTSISVEGKLNRLIGGDQYPTMKLGGLMVAEEGLEPPTRGL